MSNADTQHMIDLVERQTGYRVTVDIISGIYVHAQTITARPEAPAHIIRVNAERRQHADYIVAVQCGMMLVLWAEPTKVPGMAFEKTKCDFLAGRWAKTKQLAALTPEIAMLGRSGLDINDPAKKYTLRSLPGSFTGLHLVSLMYTGMKLVDPSVDAGIDLSQEFAAAKALSDKAEEI